MTLAELKQMIFVSVLARLEKEGRQIMDVPKEELDAITLDVAKTIKLAMDVTGEKITP